MPLIRQLKRYYDKARGRDEEPKLPGYVVPAAGLAGAGTASHFAEKGINRVGVKADAWKQTVQAASERFRTAGKLSDLTDVFKGYVHGGADLLNQRVLGIDIPRKAVQTAALMQMGRPALKAIQQHAGRGPVATSAGIVEALFEADAGGRLSPELRKRFSFILDRPILRHKTRPLSKDVMANPAARQAMEGFAGRLSHYDYFKPENLNRALQHVMVGPLQNALTSRPDLFAADAAQHIHNPNLGAAERLGKLVHGSPNKVEAYRLLKDNLAQHATAISGGLTVKGYLDKYLAARGFVDRLGRAAHYGKYMAPVGLGIGAMGAYQQLRKKAQSRDDVKDYGLIGAGALGGAESIRRGVRHLRNPLDVAVGWGEKPEFGEGHKTPGQVLEQLLEEQRGKAGVPKFNLTRVLIDREGKVDPALRGRMFDTSFSTGMSGLGPYGEGPRPGVRLGGMHGYMTDAHAVPYYGTTPGQEMSRFSPLRILPDENMAAGLKAKHPRLAGLLPRDNKAFEQIRNAPLGWGTVGRLIPGMQDTMITWGPAQKFNAKKQKQVGIVGHEAGVRQLYVSDVAPPLFKDEGIVNIKSILGPDGRVPDRGAFIQQFLADPDVVKKVPPRTQEALRNIGDKKLLVVTGSGRGDYVPLKAMELSHELRRLGMRDKFLIVPVLGRARQHNPLAAILDRIEGVAPTDFLPQKWYSSFPAIADQHLASTGTSALYEGLALPSRMSLSPDATALKAREAAIAKRLSAKRDPEMWARYQKQTGHVDLDKWNFGNREHALYFNKNVKAHQTAREVIADLLGNPGEQGAAGRANFMRNELARSKDTLREALPGLLRRQRSLKNFRGYRNLALSIPLLGVAGLAAHHRAKEH